MSLVDQKELNRKGHRFVYLAEFLYDSSFRNVLEFAIELGMIH